MLIITIKFMYEPFLSHLFCTTHPITHYILCNIFEKEKFIQNAIQYNNAAHPLSLSFFLCIFMYLGINVSVYLYKQLHIILFCITKTLTHTRTQPITYSCIPRKIFRKYRFFFSCVLQWARIVHWMYAPSS